VLKFLVTVSVPEKLSELNFEASSSSHPFSGVLASASRLCIPPLLDQVTVPPTLIVVVDVPLASSVHLLVLPPFTVAVVGAGVGVDVDVAVGVADAVIVLVSLRLGFSFVQAVQPSSKNTAATDARTFGIMVFPSSRTYSVFVSILFPGRLAVTLLQQLIKYAAQ
jgi:hypothetical protein